jgi:hypothetical protein
MRNFIEFFKKIGIGIQDMFIHYLIIFGAFVTPLVDIFILLVCLVGGDTIYAIRTAKKHKITITSHKFSNIFGKLLFYGGCVITSYFIDQEIIINGIWGIENALTKGATILFIFTEIKSIDEHRIKNGYKSIFTMLSELIEKILKLKKDLKS